tara:strand:- start:786 stop:1199 length:414 start_codon:yes stop_codon:yes gene_type:complete
MILSKMKKSYILLFLIIFTGCYEEPFFDLTIKVENSISEPVSGALVNIQIVDIDSSHVIVDQIISESYEGVTDSNGSIIFSFKNRALVTARACYNASEAYFCAEGHAYLEDNTNTQIKLLLQSDQIENNTCAYCNSQ